MTLVILIHTDFHLHTPTYLFLKAICHFWYTSVYTPKILANCISEDRHISLAGCRAQLFFSFVVTYTECYLLAAMVYDGHVAICKPLLYSGTMSSSLCTRLVAGSYIGGFLNAIDHTVNTFCLSFCGKNIINHSYVMHHHWSTKKVLVSVVGFTVLSSIPAILIFYFDILLAILRICLAGIWMAKGLLHQCYTSHLSHVLLWILALYVFKAKLHLLLGE